MPPQGHPDAARVRRSMPDPAGQMDDEVQRLTAAVVHRHVDADEVEHAVVADLVPAGGGELEVVNATTRRRDGVVVLAEQDTITGHGEVPAAGGLTAEAADL